MKMGMSRRKRLEAAQKLIGDALNIAEEQKGEVEGLKDELQEWLDNMPENLQGGEKASALEEAIQGLEEMEGQLDEAISNLNDVMMGSVEFPGMF